MILVRCAPYGPQRLKHTIPSGKFSNIVHPRHRTMVPYRKRTISYTKVPGTVFFPYHTVNIPYHIRRFSHIPYY